MNKAVMTLVALLLVPVPAVSQEAPRPGEPQTERRSDRDTRGERSNEQSELGFREQMAGALETVESACSADMRAFCDMVTPGEGRLTLCMRAHEDQISRGCRTALYRVSRGLGRAVERIADVCWNEVRALCGDADATSEHEKRRGGDNDKHAERDAQKFWHLGSMLHRGASGAERGGPTVGPRSA